MVDAIYGRCVARENGRCFFENEYIILDALILLYTHSL